MPEVLSMGSWPSQPLLHVHRVSQEVGLLPFTRPTPLLSSPQLLVMLNSCPSSQREGFCLGASSINLWLLHHGGRKRGRKCRDFCRIPGLPVTSHAVLSGLQRTWNGALPAIPVICGHSRAGGMPYLVQPELNDSKLAFRRA